MGGGAQGSGFAATTPYTPLPPNARWNDSPAARLYSTLDERLRERLHSSDIESRLRASRPSSKPPPSTHVYSKGKGKGVGAPAAAPKLDLRWPSALVRLEVDTSAYQRVWARCEPE